MGPVGCAVVNQELDVVIIGAGPAGLTAAWQLAKKGLTSTVLEGDSVVGGIARTAERDGWRFD
ncbi:MAG TPA: FAD-dependent oxidoreductase, partial [Acidimicrobiales bacterium]|nr:FAD-dependent oxidoreductase [Acidimicrobiales bacterium]